jgi:hypothetical protein
MGIFVKECDNRWMISALLEGSPSWAWRAARRVACTGPATTAHDPAPLLFPALPILFPRAFIYTVPVCT